MPQRHKTNHKLDLIKKSRGWWCSFRIRLRKSQTSSNQIYKILYKDKQVCLKTFPSIKYPQNFTKLYSFLFNIFLIPKQRANRKSIHNTHSNYFNKHILFWLWLRKFFSCILLYTIFQCDILPFSICGVSHIIFCEIKG